MNIEVNKNFFERHCENLDRRTLYGQFTDLERDFLYNFIRVLKPKKLVEFSPCNGYTTCIMASALKCEGVLPDSFETYELDESCANSTEQNLYFNDFEYVKVVCGDVMCAMDLESLKKCDFLFIDSNHDKEFAQRYVDSFFPLVRIGCYVAVHDIFYDERKNGESEVILSYLEKNNLQETYYVPDLLKKFDILDNGVNILGLSKNVEQSSMLIFRKDV